MPTQERSTSIALESLPGQPTHPRSEKPTRFGPKQPPRQACAPGIPHDGGVLLVVAILAAIFLLPTTWGVAAIVAAAAFELAEIAVFVWYSKRRRATTGAEALVGAVGVAVTPCRPQGQVRVEGELWNAVCAEGAAPGDGVIVENVDGLSLTVARLHSGRG